MTIANQRLIAIFRHFDVQTGQILMFSSFMILCHKYPDDEAQAIKDAMQEFISRGCAEDINHDRPYYKLTPAGAREVWD